MDTAFFIVSKLVYLVIQPSSLCLIMIATGLLVAARGISPRPGLKVAMAGVVAMTIAGFSPLANLVLLPLEARFPRPSLEDLGRIKGLIVLGGFEEATDPAGGLGLNEAAERITESARLAKVLPGAKVVFTGGSGALVLGDGPQADRVGRFLIDMGVSRQRIVLEDRSRTTWENAVETRRILGADAAGRWVLVTSAWHMPRAVGAFRKAGLDVVAWPVDYRTSWPKDAVRGFNSLGDGLRRLDRGVQEWIGLVAYTVTGRSSSFYPAP
jgi:uncharacterized SAM-binding protein YcdF (DUF218 family)